MKQTYGPRNDSWDEYSALFSMFDRAGVPHETRWRSLLLYFREIKDYSHLTDVEKVKIQEMFARALAKRDFSSVHLDEVLKEYRDILAAPLQNKITVLMREASDVIFGFQQLLSVRCGDISTLEEESASIITADCDIAESALRLRNAFSKVKRLLEDDIRNLETMATLDSVAKIANRRSFDLFIDTAVKRWLDESRPLCLAMFDIDHFKRFNDEHGHRIGDQVLAVVGMHLKKSLENFDRQNDVLAARYGGEEFALVVSGPNAEDLMAVTEKCRERIKRFNFLIRDAEGNVVESGLHITVSAGVALAWKGWKGSHLANLVDNADKALYFAKQTGRNRAVAFNPESEQGFSPITAAQ